jgi:hypothetical protein
VKAALVVMLLAACGGARGERTLNPPQPVVPDAAIIEVDRCRGYEIGVKPSLGRMAAAADRLSAGMGTDAAESALAARDFALSLEEERRYLESVTTGERAIDDVHTRLLIAMAALADGARVLADGLDRGDAGLRDEASTSMKQAFIAWAKAVAELQTLCPSLN